MIDQIIVSHSILVKVFLFFLVAGLFIPKMTSKNPLGFRKASFIYTMIFQAIATMVAFTGLVAIAMGEFGLTLSTMIMIAIWAALMFIEIKKYKLIKHSKVQDPQTHTLLKSAFIKISIIELLLVAVMVVLKVLEVKQVISLG